VAEIESQSGRIDVSIRVGVTGHRVLNDQGTLGDEIENAISNLIASTVSGGKTETKHRFVVVSALAEGADRLVAKKFLERGSTLEVILPLSPAEYKKDFKTPDSLREFGDLCNEAERVTVMGPQETRNLAYLACGQEVVKHSDIVVAVWDGQATRGEGGTGDIVQYAKDHQVPLIWIGTDGRHRVVLEIGDAVAEWSDLNPLSEPAFKELERFNSRLRHPRRFDDVVETFGKYAGHTPDGCELRLQSALDWIAPYYARAELQANRAQWWYGMLSFTIIACSFGAVVTVATQEIFYRDRPAIVWIEVVLLLSALACVGVGWNRQYHGLWIRSRYLGESFRSSLYLAIAGIKDHVSEFEIRDPEENATDAWMRRAYAEVWSQHPDITPKEADVGPLQRFLAESWIEDQIRYHRATSKKCDRWHTYTRHAMLALFLVSVVFSIAHSVNWLGGQHGPFGVWGFLSIGIPALIAGVGTFVAQREYQQHAIRYDQMARRLSQFKVKMESAENLLSVQELALETERVMRQENGEWFSVVRLHDLQTA
jgi:hypothetical protein